MPLAYLRRPVLAVLLLVVGLVATACTTTIAGRGQLARGDFPAPSASPSSSEGEADDLIRRVKNGFLGEKDIALKGTTTDDDLTARISGRYGYRDGHFVGTATISLGALRIELRNIGNDTWLQAPALFWSSADDPAAKAVTADQWVTITETDEWPAQYATIGDVEQLVLPFYDSHPEVTGQTTVDGEDAVLVEDSDDWSYTIVDGDSPRVVHAEGPDDDYDLTYPTDGFTVEAPPANLVVSVPGF